MRTQKELTFYTFQELANMLKVSRQTIYNYKTRGILKATKIGKEYKINENQLNEFLDYFQNK